MLIGFLSSCGSTKPLTEEEMARIRAEVDALWEAKKQEEIAKQQITAQQKREQEEYEQLRQEVRNWVGVPYRLGGNTKRGVDCSGLVVQVYKNVYGKTVHRTSNEQYQLDIAQYLNGNELKPGNLVFFNIRRRKGYVDHVGIYLNDYKFVHAGNNGVRIEDLRQRYWLKYWVAGGKVK